MKAIVIGLGSMGKRRVRCLQALDINDITGFDIRTDRRKEAEQNYGIKTEESLNQAWEKSQADIAIISLPPKAHISAMNECIKRKTPFFVEASVIDNGLAQIIEDVKKAGILAAPSSTLRFHPGISTIFKIIKGGQLGKISNILLHSGQYLPDWHTYEPVSDFYVSDPETGGAREIVPFELTWLTELFGIPRKVTGQFRKTINIPGADYIDDTYNALLDYGNFLAVITVDVVSRYATRRLTINGSNAQLIWDWENSFVSVFESEKKEWKRYPYEMKKSENGYNKNIGENMYIDEIDNFIKAVNGIKVFPNTLENDHKILKLLYAIELSEHTSKVQVI